MPFSHQCGAQMGNAVLSISWSPDWAKGV